MTDADLIREAREARARAYRSWQSMHWRCSSTYPKRRYYFDRGIAVCARWASFANFYEDMGPRPKGTTIDRENNDKGYEPGNCRWATWSEQQRNRRSNTLITHDGVTRTLIEWSEATGIPADTLQSRREKGLSDAEVFNPVVKPVRHYIEHDGKRLSITDWAKSVGMTRNALKDRLRRGWPFEKAISISAAEAARRSK